jgi:hypothetical protein
MLTKVKHDQPNKLAIYNAGCASEPVMDLLKRIGDHQSFLQNILSKEIANSCKTMSNSLSMFLNEAKNRVHLFVLTLDEIVRHTSVINKDDNSFIKNLSLSPVSYFSDQKILNEIFITTNTLCDIINQLKVKIENLDIFAFIKDFCCKSLIFYKQTQVVLKGYLRIIEEPKIDPR